MTVTTIEGQYTVDESDYISEHEENDILGMYARNHNVDWVDACDAVGGFNGITISDFVDYCNQINWDTLPKMWSEEA